MFIWPLRKALMLTTSGKQSSNNCEHLTHWRTEMSILLKGLHSESYSGPSIWNKLPLETKGSGSINSFKHNLKNHYSKKIELSR